MKTVLITLSIALFALQQQPRDAVANRPAPTGTAELSGVVTLDDSATPVRLATVTITGDQLTLGRSIVTGDDGRFTFSNLPAGRYSIAARKPAYITALFGARRPGRPGTQVSVAAGQSVGNLSLKMSRGAVITGTITDASGAPARDIQVMAVRVGDPGLEPPPGPFAPTPMTDDRGAYRIFGLAPGEYVVAAAPGALGSSETSVRSTAEVDAVLQGLQTRSRTVTPAPPRTAPNTPPPPAYGYVPVFYPGTVLSSDAQRLRVSAGEERSGMDFVVRLVPAVAIDGVVAGGDGSVPQVVMSITPMSQTIRLTGPTVGTAPRLAQPPDEQGQFRYASVSPGKYLITARSTGAAAARGRGTALPAATAGGSGSFSFGGAPGGPAGTTAWAMAEVTVGSENISGVALTLQPAMKFSGRLIFDPPGEFDPTTLRILLARVDVNYSQNVNGTAMGGISPQAVPARADGTFEVGGVLPGAYRVMSAVPGTGGWTLRSAIVGGRDALDFPVEFGQSGDISGAVLTYSNRRTELTGAFSSGSGAPAADYVILAFPADRTFWRPGSRRIKSARPATDGEFTIADLPGGEYLVAALTDLDPADADNPSFLDQLIPASVKVSIAEGEKKRQDVRVR